MKILLAVHHFPPHYTGGAEWEAFNTARALQSRGETVRVLCVERIDVGTAPGVTWEDDMYEGLAVRRLSFNLSLAPDPQRWGYDNVWIGEHLQTLLTEYRPDVFHLMGGYLLSGRALRVAAACGVPTVLSLMDFWFLCSRISMLRSDDTLATFPPDPVRCARCLGEEQRRYRLLGRVAPALMEKFWETQTVPVRRVEQRLEFLRETLNDVGVIICRSNFVRQAFIQWGIAPDRLRFLRQGRDFPELTPAAKAKTPSPELRVGYLGQLAPHKGVHVLVDAAQQLPSAALQVRLYGNPEPFPRYTARLRHLTQRDPRVQLAGEYHGQAELQNILRSLDVVVVPSLWYENSPNVILEAYGHGTPVIASNLGGMAELVTDEVNGLLFKVGDAGDLARQLQRLAAQPALVEKLRSGIGPVKSLAEEMDELEEIYRGLGR